MTPKYSLEETCLLHLVALKYDMAGDMESVELIQQLETRWHSINWADPEFIKFSDAMRNGPPHLVSQTEDALIPELKALVHGQGEMIASFSESAAITINQYKEAQKKIIPALDMTLKIMTYITDLMHLVIRMKARLHVLGDDVTVFKASPVPISMSAAPSIFTAAKLAAILGCTKRNVLNRLAGIRQRPIIAGGQQAKGYALSDLPDDMVEKLAELQSRFRFRSIEQLVANGLPSDVWQPVDMKLLHDSEIDKASALMRAMHRVLKIGAKSGGAALVSIGQEDYRREFGRSVSEGHWRRLYKMVTDRDAGAEQFDDVRLYVSENPRLKPPQGQEPSALDLQLEIIRPCLVSIRKVSDLSKDEIVDIWHCAFQQAESLEQSGATRLGARAIVLDCIRNHGVSLAKTDKALEKAWKRKYMAWVNGGRVSQALDDGRKDNPGAVPLAMMTPDECKQVRALVLKTDPNYSSTVITSMALRMYAQTAECRPELREAIMKPRSSKHKITTVLKSQARVTAESKMLYRGDKTFKLNGHKQPRGLFYVDKEGNEQPILPGTLFECDDMHFNQPFYVPWDDPNDPCAAKYGVRAFRAQLLPDLDVGSGRFLTYGMALRYTDAYRGEDILWTHLNVFNAVGVPEWLRFERGTWEAEIVRRLDAIAPIHTSFQPGTKFIESRFNVLQKVMGLHGVNIGRGRGEFEETNKDWVAVRAGKMHPEKAGFLTVHQISEALNKSMLYINADPMEGEVYKGVPDEIWSKHFENRSLRKLTKEESMTLQPERREVRINAGHVCCDGAAHQATYYFNASLFAHYGTGYKVTVCFDPANPEGGAFILNREEGARAHRNAEGRAFKQNEFMCWAEHVARAPQFSMASRVEDRDLFERKKRFTEQCRQLFGVIMPFNRGTPYRVAQTNDGRGHVERVDVYGTTIERREVGAQERNQEKVVRQIRAKERQMGMSRAVVVKNPERMLEGLNDYEKALADLESEQTEGGSNA